jgi:DNA invertase Pin-like site-specific DNA recombinase
MTNQNLEKNKADILQLGNQHDLSRVRFAEEIASGKVFWQERKIAEALESLRSNEVIVVNELSRLGRSTLECMETLSIAVQKQTNVYAVKGSCRTDQSIQSKILAMAFSMAAEIECDLISQRTKDALRLRRAQGLKLGRPIGPGKSKLDPYRPEIEGLLANGSTQIFIARRYRATRPNFTVSSENTC